ncbi:MAG: hypothetical protein RLZZ396_587 [Planctomycetota bacterium]
MAILRIIDACRVHGDSIGEKHDQGKESDEDRNAQRSKESFENKESWGYE